MSTIREPEPWEAVRDRIVQIILVQAQYMSLPAAVELAVKDTYGRLLELVVAETKNAKVR